MKFTAWLYTTNAYSEVAITQQGFYEGYLLLSGAEGRFCGIDLYGRFVVDELKDFFKRHSSDVDLSGVMIGSNMYSGDLVSDVEEDEFSNLVQIAEFEDNVNFSDYFYPGMLI